MDFTFKCPSCGKDKDIDEYWVKRYGHCSIHKICMMCVISYMPDSYIENSLKNQKVPISPDTIKLKKQQLLIHRQIKQLQNETN